MTKKVFCGLGWLAAMALVGTSGLSLAQAPVPPAADSVLSAQAERDTERAQLQQTRNALQAQRASDEAQCYQRFAVESCLQKVRADTRSAEALLREREVTLNDAERREKAANRRRSVEENLQQQQAREAAAAAQPKTPAASAAARQASSDDKAQQARQRADQQRARQSGHAADQERRETAEPNRIAESRARYEAKQQAAQERRAKHDKARAEAETSGRKQPAALPPPQWPDSAAP
ncbi:MULTISPECIES: hypothetical protein [unclassified Acidovorax]|uniref:hypothetical protein n=1 Tax=unclassified Acidovorax TaxID=2684926 RepID=UPI0028830880|nr:MULTISPECIES: hypothetical protein [unclassified Acidovorax]